MLAPLISPEDLDAALRGPSSPTVLDCRWTLNGPPGIDAYRRGHIPGARFVDLDAELAGAPGAGGRHPLPPASAFEASMRGHGVRGDRQVVVYDAATGMGAARAWWCLRYFGHGDVRLLDGGYAAWEAAGLPVETEVQASEPGDFTAGEGHLPVLDADAAAALARNGVLLDARAPERFRGEKEPVDPVAGHIPGAVNLPVAELVDEGGRLRPADALRARFLAAGARPDVPVGAYCGSGVTAALEVFAAEVAGIDAALYPGSWSEWIRDSSRAVERSQTATQG